mgnify:CR=1 FL=1
MTEYFMDRTKGKLPVSLTDVQSPINMLSYLLPITDLFMEVYDDPDGVKEAAMLSAKLLAEFLNKQKSDHWRCTGISGTWICQQQTVSWDRSE